MMHRVLCVVKHHGGWCVQSCRKTILGWRLEKARHVPGESLQDMLVTAGIRGQKRSMLAVGVEREQVLLRVGSGQEKAFPAGEELVFWSRAVEKDGLRQSETAAMRVSALREIWDEASAAGFGGCLVFPVWMGALVAIRKAMRGEMIAWQTGRITRGEEAWSPWEHGDTPASSSQEAAEFSARGGLLLTLGGTLPPGWATIPSPRVLRSRAIIGLLAIVAAILWFGLRSAGLDRELAAEAVRAKRLQHELSKNRTGCHISDLIVFLNSAAIHGSASGITGTQLDFLPHQGMVIRGRAQSASDAREFLDRLSPRRSGLAVTKEEGRLVFRAEVALPCVD